MGQLIGCNSVCVPCSRAFQAGKPVHQTARQGKICRGMTGINRYTGVIMKLAIITGASAGIGFASAEKFLQQGFAVINVSRRDAALSSVINMNCDLSNLEEVEELCPKLLEQINAAETVCLVHNACRMAKDSALQCDSNDLQTTLAVNIVAPTVLNSRLLSFMPQGSSVIYIGSTLSEKAVANSYSYASSKHAVVGMMRASCQDLAGRGIHTACVCPGFTATEMLKTHLGNDPEVLLEVGGQNGFHRLIEPAEIADFIAWVHENPVVNGAVLHAHLGQLQN